jgi:uncharacterized membrane protein
MGHILSFVGIILGFIGMKGLAEHYRVYEIYKKTCTSVLLGITSLVFFAVWPIVISLFDYWVLTILLHNRPGGWIYTNVMPSLMFGILFAFMLLVALIFRKALSILTIQSGKRLFYIAGIILLLGTLLPFAFTIGFAIDTVLSNVLQNWTSLFLWWSQSSFPFLELIWIAFLVLAIAFFSLNVNPDTQPHNYNLQHEELVK